LSAVVDYTPAAEQNEMQNATLQKIVDQNLRKDLPEFRPGDTIRVHVRIREGEKERLQAFEGVVIARKNSGLGETITVRKVSFGQGVEHFPGQCTGDRSHRLHSNRSGSPRQTVLPA